MGASSSAGDCGASAVAADVLAQLLVDLGSLLDAVVEHGAPLFGVLVEGTVPRRKLVWRMISRALLRSWERRRISLACWSGMALD
jgi:hypothetical protein